MIPGKKSTRETDAVGEFPRAPEPLNCSDRQSHAQFDFRDVPPAEFDFPGFYPQRRPPPEDPHTQDQ